MELPKNTTQIGEMHSTYKIFIEDYVISYLKQITRQEPDRKKKIILYGIQKLEEHQHYFFIYEGADELSESAEMLFQGHVPLGFVVAEDELPEGIHLLVGGKEIYIEGYRIFYEKNEGMLAYLIHRQKIKEVKPAVASQEASLTESKDSYNPPNQSGQYVTMKYRQQAREEIHRNEIPGIKLVGIVKCAAAAFLIVLCVTAISAINGVDKLVGFQNFFQKGVEAMGEETGTPVTSNKVIDENTTTVSANEQPVPAESTTETESAAEINPIPEAEPIAEADPIPEAQLTPETQPVVEPTVNVEETSNEEPVTSQTPASNTHTVLKGETLNVISKIYYGDDSRVKDICAANGIANPNNIKIGQKIILP